MVKAGESSRDLETTLAELSALLENEQRIQHRVYGIQFHLIAVLAVAAVVALTLISRTRTAATVLGESANCLLLAGILIAVTLGCWLAQRTGLGRRWLDIWRLKSPVLGFLHSRIVLARCIRTMGLLWSHNVPIFQVLKVVRETVGNAAVSDAVHALANAVKEGESLAEPLRALGLFPGPMCAIVNTSDNPFSGHSELLRLADDLDALTDDALEGLWCRLVPSLIILEIILLACLVVSITRSGL